MYNKLEILNKVLSELGVLIIVFTFGILLGIYSGSKNIERLATDNIVKERKIQEQAEKISELQSKTRNSEKQKFENHYFKYNILC